MSYRGEYDTSYRNHEWKFEKEGPVYVVTSNGQKICITPEEEWAQYLCSLNNRKLKNKQAPRRGRGSQFENFRASNN